MDLTHLIFQPGRQLLLMCFSSNFFFSYMSFLCSWIWMFSLYVAWLQFFISVTGTYYSPFPDKRWMHSVILHLILKHSCSNCSHSMDPEKPSDSCSSFCKISKIQHLDTSLINPQHCGSPGVISEREFVFPLSTLTQDLFFWGGPKSRSKVHTKMSHWRAMVIFL